MRVALGTVELTDEMREALAHYFGQTGKAPREQCRRYLLDNGMNGLDDVMADYDASREARS